MATEPTASAGQRRGTGPDPVEVLALVAAATISDLSSDTRRALRLVCRGIKEAVDESINAFEVKERVLKIWAEQKLSTPINSRTAGLTYLSCILQEWEDDVDLAFQLINVLIIATHNSQNLERLKLRWDSLLGKPHGNRVLRTAAAMLGSHRWDKLEDLTIVAAPSTLSSLFNHHSAPSFVALRRLVILGKLSVNDMATLSSLESLCSRVEDFALGECFNGTESARYDHMARLLDNLTKVSTLELDLSGATTLEFFANAELPALEKMLFVMISDISLEPFLRLPRQKCTSLSLYDPTNAAAASRLTPFLQSSRMLPAIKSLYLENFPNFDWSCLDEIQLSTLTSLQFQDCCFSPEDVINVARAASRLPQLKLLQLIPEDAENEDEESMFYEGARVAMQHLLSGTGLKNLRQLVTGGDWCDNDESLQVLIDHAEATPKLCKVLLQSGSFTQHGIDALVEAGRDGTWPELKGFAFQRFKFVEESDWDMLEPFKCLLRTWPGLNMRVGKEAGEYVSDIDED